MRLSRPASLRRNGKRALQGSMRCQAPGRDRPWAPACGGMARGPLDHEIPSARRDVQSPSPRISRADVFGVVEGQPITPAGSLAAFLVSMAWGYGSVAYGPWRVARILETAKGRAGAKLARASTVLKELGPESAYEALGAPLPAGLPWPGVRDQVPVLPGRTESTCADHGPPDLRVADENTGLPLTATRWSAQGLPALSRSDVRVVPTPRRKALDARGDPVLRTSAPRGQSMGIARVVKRTCGSQAPDARGSRSRGRTFVGFALQQPDGCVERVAVTGASSIRALV